MRKVILLILVFVFIGILKSQSLTLKINNKTDYDIEGIRVTNQQTVSIYRGDFIVVQDLKEIIVKNLSLLPVYLNTGFIYNKPNRLTPPLLNYEPPYFHDTLRNCEIEYDLNISENQYGYKLFYTFVKIKRKPAIINKSISQKNAWISDRFVGNYYPVNTEGDTLPAVCKEGILKINDDNTFNYILTPDIEWCKDMKEYTYEGSCEEKGDTLILYNKGFKTPIEPRFSIMDVDTGKTILISLFNDNGEAITIAKASSINSVYRSANLNQINIPFKYNSIEIKDKRIFGVNIFPVGYPEVQIVLKKIRASAKINIILSATYYDAIFNGRKFIFENNTLTEITGERSQYIKAK